MARRPSESAKKKFMQFYCMVVDYTRMYGLQHAGYSIAEGRWMANNGGKRAYRDNNGFKYAKANFMKAWPNVDFFVVRLKTKNIDACVETGTDFEALKLKYLTVPGHVIIFSTSDGFLSIDSKVVYEKK